MEPVEHRSDIREKRIAATPGQVYAALGDPARVARWWGPAGFTNTIHTFDFRPGGTWRLTMHGPDGKDYPNCKELGGPTHACSSVALTPYYSFAITVGGLNVRDVRTGELAWLSPGFAPRGCVNPALASGRVFWPSAASGMIYCWEPEESDE